MTKYISIPDSKKSLKIEIEYDIWGYNHFSSKNSKRWIYVYFQTVEVSWNFETCKMFGEEKDFKILLSEEKRLNKKKLEKYKKAFEEYHELIWDSWMLEFHNRKLNPFNLKDTLDSLLQK